MVILNTITKLLLKHYRDKSVQCIIDLVIFNFIYCNHVIENRWGKSEVKNIGNCQTIDEGKICSDNF